MTRTWQRVDQMALGKPEQARMQESVWNAFKADRSEMHQAGEWSEPA